MDMDMQRDRGQGWKVLEIWCNFPSLFFSFNFHVSLVYGSAIFAFLKLFLIIDPF